MRMLSACEYSGIVRDAFSRQGWDAWSCDLLPTESELTKSEKKHIQGDVTGILDEGWDLMIAFPPCTYLAVSGNRWFANNPERWQAQVDAALFAFKLLNSNIKHIALENPVSRLSTYIGKPTQTLLPSDFGETFMVKTCCLWLKNLPFLFPTKMVQPEYDYVKDVRRKNGFSRYPKGYNSMAGDGKGRSKFWVGVAEAMAVQWTAYFEDSRLWK